MIYALGWLSRFPKKILIFVFIWGQPDSLLERKNTNGVGKNTNGVGTKFKALISPFPKRENPQISKNLSSTMAS